MELTAPEDVETLLAVAQVDLESSSPQDAVPRLEKVIAAQPRNQTARLGLMTAYKLLNDSQKLAEHEAVFEAIGGVLSHRRE